MHKVMHVERVLLKAKYDLNYKFLCLRERTENPGKDTEGAGEYRLRKGLGQFLRQSMV